MTGSPRPVPMFLLAATLALHALLAAGVLGGLPPEARIALAMLVLVMLPGHGWLAALGAAPPGGPWLASGWALALGVAWLGLQVMVTRVLHLPFTVLVAGAAVPNALPWLVAIGRRREPASSARDADALRGLALAAVAIAAVVAAVYVARIPPPVGYNSDSPDHIGTIRRMMAEGDAFPADAFFRDAGRAGADPRKGLWHPCIALVATLARADALLAWLVLAAMLAPLFVINAAAFGFLLGGPAAAAIAAWGLLLTYGGSMASQYLREAVFATKLADQMALATATAVLADLEPGARRMRAAAVGLALGAVATHVFAALQFGVVFSALGVGLLVRERGAGPLVRRLVATCAALALACLPYLLWRAGTSYAPNNIIHTEPQGLMVLSGSARVVDPAVLWDWLGARWILFPLSWWAWAREAKRPAVLYLLTTSIAVAAILFFPPLVGLLQPRLGYLLMRFVWLLPLSGVLAFAIPSLLRAIRDGHRLARAGAAAGLAALVLLVLPVVRDAANALARPGQRREFDAQVSPLRWREALAWMDANLPAGTVVLSDPATSYSVPMMTRHWVTTLVDQHSSPNDSLALSRILDARDALDPGAPYARLREVVQRWGATTIALNDRFPVPPLLDYWAPRAGWFVRARARLDARPDAFRRVYDRGGFVVYRIDRPALDTLSGGAAQRPYVRALDADRARTARAVGPMLPEVLGVTLGAREARPGDSLVVAIDWRVRQPLPAGSYSVVLRFDRAMPPGFEPPAWCAKPARKVLERLRHERYRFRDGHLPVHGDYGVDLWRPGQVVSDSTTVFVPGDVAPGDYRVEVTMLRLPHYPVFRLSDFFFDHDVFSGIPVGSLRVVGDARAH